MIPKTPLKYVWILSWVLLHNSWFWDIGILAIMPFLNQIVPVWFVKTTLLIRFFRIAIYYSEEEIHHHFYVYYNIYLVLDLQIITYQFPHNIYRWPKSSATTHKMLIEIPSLWTTTTLLFIITTVLGQYMTVVIFF